jgi:hypothetical protein
MELVMSIERTVWRVKIHATPPISLGLEFRFKHLEADDIGC